MFYKWRRKLKTWNFDRQISAIMETPPLLPVPANWSIVSMIRDRDVPMYILGIKAFYSYLGGGQVIGIIHHDLPQRSRDLLRRHVEGIEILVREEIDTGRCQRGGTWERLVYLLGRSADEYVIQMDADILAVGPDLNEIKDCIARNIAFTMTDGHQFHSMRKSAELARATDDGSYVGGAIESLFDRYPDCDRLRYIRGSSGLAGFARGGFTRAGIEEFHQVMQNLLPDRWHEWGSEQCGSNFAVANSPNSIALPYPAYASFGRGMDFTNTKCFHFIGANRFQDGYFASRGREAIQKLNRPLARAA